MLKIYYAEVLLCWVFNLLKVYYAKVLLFWIFNLLEVYFLWVYYAEVSLSRKFIVLNVSSVRPEGRTDWVLRNNYAARVISIVLAKSRPEAVINLSCTVVCLCMSVRERILMCPGACTYVSGSVYRCVRESVPMCPGACTDVSGSLYWCVRERGMMCPNGIDGRSSFCNVSWELCDTLGYVTWLQHVSRVFVSVIYLCPYHFYSNVLEITLNIVIKKYKYSYFKLLCQANPLKSSQGVSRYKFYLT